MLSQEIFPKPDLAIAGDRGQTSRIPQTQRGLIADNANTPRTPRTHRGHRGHIVDTADTSWTPRTHRGHRGNDRGHRGAGMVAGRASRSRTSRAHRGHRGHIAGIADTPRMSRARSRATADTIAVFGHIWPSELKGLRFDFEIEAFMFTKNNLPYRGIGRS